VVVLAREDPSLEARVVARRALVYADGPDPALDRPAHVRAASGLAWVAGRLAVIQDDANFLAIVDPATGRADAVLLPAGPGGRRQLSKAEKLDLEACVALPPDPRGAPGLLAFGSGSTPRRERVALARFPPDGEPERTLIEAPAVYASLRAAREFAGSALNVEGAALVPGGALRLFNRGNGAPRAGVPPVDATCDIDLGDLLDHLLRGAPPPPPRAIVRYDLGAISGVRLTFTDAEAFCDAILYAAVAEDTPDPIRDGPIAGAAVGMIDASGRAARFARLRDRAGAPLAEKIEGIASAPREGRLFAVTDRDEPGAPSELLEIALAGPW
jgi:hypothetical protein